MPETTKKTTIAEDVYAQLREQILSGVYAAGDRLPPERDLAAALGTNRNTLREAVRRLEQANLLTVRQGSGATVCDFRRTGGIELLEPFLMHGSDVVERARALVDLLAARTEVLEFAVGLATARATIQDVARLTGLRMELVDRFDRGDHAGLAKGYERWIDALIDASHSLPTRWIANPFLRLNRRFMEEFPALWVLDASFPHYLRETELALADRDLPRATRAHHEYYQKIDAIVVPLLRQVLGDEVTLHQRTVG